MSSASVADYPHAYSPQAEDNFSMHLTLGNLSIKLDWPIQALTQSTQWLKIDDTIIQISVELLINQKAYKFWVFGGCQMGLF